MKKIVLSIFLFLGVSAYLVSASPAHAQDDQNRVTEDVAFQLLRSYIPQVMVYFSEMKNSTNAIYHGDVNQCDTLMVLYEQVESTLVYVEIDIGNGDPAVDQVLAKYVPYLRESIRVAREGARDVYLLCGEYSYDRLSDHNYGRAIKGFDQAESIMNGLLIVMAEDLGTTQADLTARLGREGDYIREGIREGVASSQNQASATIEQLSLQATGEKGMYNLNVNGFWPRDCYQVDGSGADILADSILLNIEGSATRDATTCNRVKTNFNTQIPVDMSYLDLSYGVIAVETDDDFFTLYLDTFTSVKTTLNNPGGMCLLESGIIGETTNFCMNVGNQLVIRQEGLLLSAHQMTGRLDSYFSDSDDVFVDTRFSIRLVEDTKATSPRVAANRIINNLNANGVKFTEGSANWGGSEVFTVQYTPNELGMSEMRLGFVVHDSQLYMARFAFSEETEAEAVDGFWDHLAGNVYFY